MLLYNVVLIPRVGYISGSKVSPKTNNWENIIAQATKSFSPQHKALFKKD